MATLATINMFASNVLFVEHGVAATSGSRPNIQTDRRGHTHRDNETQKQALTETEGNNKTEAT